MLADDLAIGLADAFQIARIFLLVGEIPGHRGDVMRLAAGRTHDGNDILQRLLDLPDEIVGFELALAVPADLAADEYQPPLRLDAVGVADRSGPALRLQDRVHASSPDDG